MISRLKSWVVLAFILLALYLVLWRDDTPFNAGEHPIDVLHGENGEMKGSGGGLEVEPILDDIPHEHLPAITKVSQPLPSQMQRLSSILGPAKASIKATPVYAVPISSLQGKPSTTAFSAQTSSTEAAENIAQEGGSKLQEQFQEENDALDR